MYPVSVFSKTLIPEPAFPDYNFSHEGLFYHLSTHWWPFHHRTHLVPQQAAPGSIGGSSPAWEMFYMPLN